MQMTGSACGTRRTMTSSCSGNGALKLRISQDGERTSVLRNITTRIGQELPSQKDDQIGQVLQIEICQQYCLPYHLPPQQICFTHKLESVTSRFCGLVAVFLLCGFCLLLVFVLVFLLWFGSLFFGCGFPF